MSQSVSPFLFLLLAAGLAGLSIFANPNRKGDLKDFLLHFSVTVSVAILYVSSLAAVMRFALTPDQAVSYVLPNLRMLVDHPLGIVFLAAVPSILGTLIAKLFVARQFKKMFRRTKTSRRLTMNLLSGIAGAVTGSLLLAALSTAIPVLVGVIIPLKIFGIL